MSIALIGIDPDSTRVTAVVTINDKPTRAEGSTEWPSNP